MPKKMNTNKAAAAVYQNAKAIEEFKRNGGLAGAVTRALGNRGFEVQLRVAAKGESTHGVLVQATPRTLFQGGKKAPVRIAVGHVVLLAGELKAKDCGVQRPLEIVARIDSKDEIRELIKLGLMSSAVLGIAETAGAMANAAAEVAADDLFDSDDSDGDFWAAGMKDVKGGLKAQRQAAEAVATITARVATLKSQKGRKGIDGGVEAGDLADPALFADPDYERFTRWRAHKATARAMAGGGSSAAPVVAVAQPEAVQTMAELMLQFKLEKEAALHAADQAAIVAAAEAGQRAAEVKAWAAKQGAKANWDDEVCMDDL
jgi:hypothetical protein